MPGFVNIEPVRNGRFKFKLEVGIVTKVLKEVKGGRIASQSSSISYIQSQLPISQPDGFT